MDKKTFLQIVKSQERYKDKGVYEYVEWKKLNAITKIEIDELLGKLKETDKVKIWIYEWESGY